MDGVINSGQGHGWQATGEIDIMELIGSANDHPYGNKTVYQTLHYGEKMKIKVNTQEMGLYLA